MEKRSLQPKTFFERYIIRYNGNIDDVYSNIKHAFEDNTTATYTFNSFNSSIWGYHKYIKTFQDIISKIPQVSLIKSIGPDIFYYVYVIYLLDTHVFRNILHYYQVVLRMIQNKQPLDMEKDNRCIIQIPYDKSECLKILKSWISTETDLTIFFIALECYLFYCENQS